MSDSDQGIDYIVILLSLISGFLGHKFNFLKILINEPISTLEQRFRCRLCTASTFNVAFFTPNLSQLVILDFHIFLRKQEIRGNGNVISTLI